MKRRSGKLAAGMLLLVGVLLGSLLPDGGRAGAAVTRDVTLAGPDFRSIDPVFVSEFVSGTGGGVTARVQAGFGAERPAADFWVFEANIDLPVGAKVIEATFYGCGLEATRYYFGSYAPASRGFSYHLPEASAPTRERCPTTYALKRTGNPIASVVAGRRYVAGFHFLTVAGSRSTVSGAQAITGARLRYTCATAC